MIKNNAHRYVDMRERAAERMAAKIFAFLADQHRGMTEAGWDDGDVALVFNEALSQCLSKP